MHHHRFRDQQTLGPVTTAIAPAPAGDAFMVCPVALCSGWMGALSSLAAYQLAYERARAVLRPSIVERLQVVSWN
ncbi:MAG TPA: hypothetical protein VMG10_20680 [Gemmataceae bacterium]|nr:hypothetical protein [Gemmataceae bacterium]